MSNLKPFNSSQVIIPEYIEIKAREIEDKVSYPLHGSDEEKIRYIHLCYTLGLINKDFI